MDFIPKAKDMSRTVLRPMEEAEKQYATIVSKRLNISYDEALVRVKKKLAEKVTEPIVEHYHRKDNGDREVRSVTLTEYLRLAEDKVLAPTFTQYYTEDQKKAMMSNYIANNLAMRTATKDLMFAAFASSNPAKRATGNRLDNEQANWKGKSNDCTGLFRSMGSALYNPSCHTTLTSLSRIVTSTNNTSSERLLQGRKHYHTYDITINNLNSIVTNLQGGDYYLNWANFIENWNIHVPTVIECIAVVKRSTKLYWYNPSDYLKISKYISTLDNIERCAIAYSGDFHAFRVYNNDLVHKFITEFTQKHHGDVEYDRVALKNIPDELLNYIHHRFSNDIIDLGVKYEKYDDQTVSDMCRTALHVQSVLVKYLEMLSVLFVHSNLPPVVYDVYHMVRDSVLMSDTDSGANTLQEWVLWYYGNTDVTESALAVSNALVYLNGIVVKVYVKQVSKNINMAEARLDTNVMELKNEFTWMVFGLMSISKHYFSGVNIREGSVFLRKLEVKGGSLKSDSIPLSVKKDVVYDKLMDYILTAAESGKVSLYECIDIIITLEQDIIDDLYNGGHEYVRKLTINEPTAYAISDPKKNSYQHCVMWNDVFAESTGFTAVAPYLTYKYPTTLKGITKIRAWVTGIPDDKIRNDMGKWMADHNKTALNIIYLPAEYVNSYGVPDYIKPAVATKRVVLDLCNMAYIVLESLAYYKPLGLTLSEIFPYRVKKE